MDGYRSKDWKKFREEVIRLDGGACSNCNRTPANGVVLQVHHKRYVEGRKPWEYPYDACYTLCSGCHAAEHGKIPPKFGWTFAGWDDLGALDGICDLCGKALRYTFLVAHSAWQTMEVGEECCDNLTCTQEASNLAESRRRFAGRLKRFVDSSRWEVFPNGRQAITQKGFLVSIRPAAGGYRTSVDGETGKALHGSLLDAKAAIFEAIDSGKVRDWFVRHPRKRF